MSDRLQQIRAFLDSAGWAGIEPHLFAGDASARRYFRLKGRRSAVLMDAPPSKEQSIAPFCAVARHLLEAGFAAPHIYAKDTEAGFLLLEDFGDGVFAKLIDAAPANELPLYRAACDVLVALDHVAPLDGLPAYTAETMAEMLAPAFEWYLWEVTGSDGDGRVLKSAMADSLTRIEGVALSLRDFHAENLMWLPRRQGLQRVGLLDFQDAMVGPVCYDLASLLFDTRRDVDQHVFETVLAEFAERTGRLERDVRFAVCALGAQRNLRILGVFTRLALKLGKPRYLDFLPRVWRYVEDCVAHPGLERVAEAVAKDVLAPAPAIIDKLKDRCGTAQDR